MPIWTREAFHFAHARQPLWLMFYRTRCVRLGSRWDLARISFEQNIISSYASPSQSQGHNHWGSGPLNIVIDPQLWTEFLSTPPIVDSAHVCLNCSLRVFIEQSIISRFSFQILFQLYPVHQIERFEVRNSEILLGMDSSSPQTSPRFLIELCLVLKSWMLCYEGLRKWEEHLSSSSA